eukprot:3167637-Pyramimonas_sp.AAC.2
MTGWRRRDGRRSKYCKSHGRQSGGGAGTRDKGEAWKGRNATQTRRQGNIRMEFVITMSSPSHHQGGQGLSFSQRRAESGPWTLYKRIGRARARMRTRARASRCAFPPRGMFASTASPGVQHWIGQG